MTARRYDDPCGIARALDAVGDRWALLVVRELIFGPKRFIQLRHGLHGVSPNVLSQRLRDLEDGGIVHRDVLDPPAGVAVYELTPRGRALEPVLLELGRWGSQEPPAAAGELSASALLLALKTVFDPAAAADATFALQHRRRLVRRDCRQRLDRHRPRPHRAPRSHLRDRCGNAALGRLRPRADHRRRAGRAPDRPRQPPPGRALHANVPRPARPATRMSRDGKPTRGQAVTPRRMRPAAHENHTFQSVA